MADPSNRGTKRKLFFYDSSDDEKIPDFDSDDSVKDKDYCESDSETISSTESSEEVSN